MGLWLTTVAFLAVPAALAADGGPSRIATGASIPLDCPERPLERVPQGPVRLMPAIGEMQVVASSTDHLLVQSGTSHRGWTPQACADAPLEVLPVHRVTETEPPRRGPALALHWTPGCDGGDTLIEAAEALARKRPDLRVQLIAHGEESSVLDAVPHPSPMTLWWDPQDTWTTAGDLPRVERWAADGSIQTLPDPEGGWDAKSLEEAFPERQDTAYTLDTMISIEQTTNAAIQQPYLSAACGEAAVAVAAVQSPTLSRYVRWLTTLVDQGALHDMALWDTTTLSLPAVTDGAAVRCIAETISPFVVLRGTAEPVFTSIHIPADRSVSEGMAMLSALATKRNLRFLWVHLGRPSLSPAELGADTTAFSRELHLQPKRAVRTELTQRFGLPRSGGTLLILY